MQIVAGCSVLAAMAAIGAWYHFGPAAIKRRIAHYLMASAAGDDARRQTFAAAMRQTVRLEEGE